MAFWQFRWKCLAGTDLATLAGEGPISGSGSTGSGNSGAWVMPGKATAYHLCIIP